DRIFGRHARFGATGVSFLTAGLGCFHPPVFSPGRRRLTRLSFSIHVQTSSGFSHGVSRNFDATWQPEKHGSLVSPSSCHRQEPPPQQLNPCSPIHLPF